MRMSRLLLTFYGDDFTGSTDAMECLELNGIPAVLFLSPPTPTQIEEEFGGVAAVGVAGVSRTMTPEEMDRELPPVFSALKQLGAYFFHYKICSTFDSSPEIGSVGRAIDIGWKIFEPVAVPVMVGAPFLRRYVVFGNLFARVGETTYRLDRHPTMSKHPVTPMGESDLRLHLARQTRRRIELVDVWHMSKRETEVDERFQRLISNGAEVILFDTLNAGHMLQIGRLIWSLKADTTVFLVGSSGIEYALGMYLRSRGRLAIPEVARSAGRKAPIVVLCGSCAPGTAAQIAYALERGFRGIRLDCPRLVDPERADQEREAALARTLEALERGQSVVLYTARGPDDPAIEETNRRLTQLGLNGTSAVRHLGPQLGRLLRAVLERTRVRRACVAGGDTCGYVAKELGLYALRVAAPISPGAPLCRAYLEGGRFDGLEISLKGGQNGSAAYFDEILQGSSQEQK